MMKKCFQLMSVVFALMLVFSVFSAPAFADEGKDESGQSEEQAKEDEKQREDAEESDEDSAEEQDSDDGSTTEADDSTADESDDDTSSTSSTDTRDGDDGQRTTASRTTTQSTQTDDGGGETVTNDKACPGGTGFKIDNLRSNGTYGPITISNFTNTSFTWTSTVNVTAVMVKDGGGDKANPGGTSGTATSFGQDISHVTFCLSGDEVGGEVIEKPCDADASMAGIQECDKDEEEVCDAMPDVAGVQECVKVDERPSRPIDDVLGVQLRRAPAAPAAPEVAPEQVAAGALPFTGGAIISFLISALGLIAVGGTLLIRRR